MIIESLNILAVTLTIYFTFYLEIQ